jgi:hypothetical protein
VTWELRPELDRPELRAALLAAVEQALREEGESAWWRSGFEDLVPLGGGPAPEQAWGDAGVVES